MRLDIYLVENGFCDSRSKAQRLINENRVLVNKKNITKASFDVTDNNTVEIEKSSTVDYVGRGGLKLEHTFSVFNYDVSGKICLDIGASTGGFTQCLLLHGAEKVYAVDSGRNQLANELLNDSRVVSIEGFNARNLTVDILDNHKVDVVVMDVSFISQKLLYPAILNVANDGADVITLIKPQFEAGKPNIGKNGIVKSEKVRKSVVNDIISFAKEMGFEFIDVADSPITGGDGNVEFLLHLKVKHK